MERRAFVRGAGALALLAVARVSSAQPKLARVALLSPLAPDDPEVKRYLAAFVSALRDLGWIEARSIRLEYRFASGDVAQLRRHAAELVAMKPDLMVVQSNLALAIMREIDRSIPTVFVSVSDPLGEGFVKSLARPGGNATGFTNYEPATGGKWLQLLKEIAPAISRVTVLLNSQIVANVQLSRAVESAAESLGVRATLWPATAGAEMERAIDTLARERAGGLIVMPNPSNLVNHKLIINACARHKLPAVYPFTYMARNGGLVGYGLDHSEIFRRVSSYVDRILKGASPAEMPVQLPTRFELVINLGTAKALGLSIPPALLARANELVE